MAASPNKVRLKAPVGTDEANHSVSFGKPYKVDPNTGIVEVDPEAVAPLLDKGGFTLADPPAPVAIADGMEELVNQDDPGASVSFDGKSYAPDADGVLQVPVKAVHALRAHGFRPKAESHESTAVSSDSGVAPELVAVVAATVDAVVHEAVHEAMQEEAAAKTEAPKPADNPKPAEAPKAAEKPAEKPVEATKPEAAPKAAEAAKPAPEAPKPAHPAAPAQPAPAAEKKA
jgi:hypothetical protein